MLRTGPPQEGGAFPNATNQAASLLICFVPATPPSAPTGTNWLLVRLVRMASVNSDMPWRISSHMGRQRCRLFLGRTSLGSGGWLSHLCIQCVALVSLCHTHMKRSRPRSRLSCAFHGTRDGTSQSRLQRARCFDRYLECLTRPVHRS